MPLETPARVAAELASRGYNAEREAVTLLAGAGNPEAALVAAIDAAPDDALVITADHVREVLADQGDTRRRDTLSTGGDDEPGGKSDSSTVGSGGGKSTDATPPDAAPTDPSPTDATPTDPSPEPSDGADPSVSTGADTSDSSGGGGAAPVETKGSSERSVSVAGDVTDESTGTGEYGDFVATFRDRYEKLASQLRGRVNHRPTDALEAMPGGGDAGLVGMVSDVRSTANGHWLVELEDTKGVFPCLVMKDRGIADLVDQLLLDEVIAVEGTLADDGGILFVDSLHFPDVPRTYSPNTADRHVQAALVSDVHVGSQEFMADAWHRFADWLHTEEAANIEYLLVAGDMVEGVGVYPGQDEELDVVDIYDQYETFSEHLKAVPGGLEIVMIPGNHDAVRLAEPQPGFEENLRDIMRAHDARIHGNPSLVTVEGVKVLMYHGVSLDEVIAELPEEKASYDEPQKAMYQLLKKRHVAPQYGGQTRLAPEEEDYLVIEEVPDVFHTGHVHKLGWGKYRNVLAVNSGCWQAQTAFQESVNIDPDAGFAPILDLDTLEMTVRKFT